MAGHSAAAGPSLAWASAQPALVAVFALVLTDHQAVQRVAALSAQAATAPVLPVVAPRRRHFLGGDPVLMPLASAACLALPPDSCTTLMPSMAGCVRCLGPLTLQYWAVWARMAEGTCKAGPVQRDLNSGTG